MNIYYTIYEVTNNVNGRKYRGVHQTSNPNDSYLGSGPSIKAAIRKYGRQSFTKEIICCAITEEYMFELEKLFVDEAWVMDLSTYNRKIGGVGGAGNRSDDVKHKISKTLTGRPKPAGFGTRLSIIKRHQPPTRPKGTTNTADHNSRISASKKGKPSHQSTCPHCGKTGGTGAMARHHFNNCKLRK